MIKMSLYNFREEVLKNPKHPLHKRLLKDNEIIKKRESEICDICGMKYTEHDSRGFTIVTDGKTGTIKYRVGWECIESLIDIFKEG